MSFIRKLLPTGLISLFCFICFPQISRAQSNSCAIFWVQFSDKDNSGYSLSRPQEFLSQKSIDRRTKYEIPFDNKDLPVNQEYVDRVKNIDGFSLIGTSKWLNGVVASCCSSTITDSLKNLPFVIEVKEIKPFLQSKISVEQEQLINTNRSILTNIDKYQLFSDEVTSFNLNFLHELGYKGQGMTIGILDAGFSFADKLVPFEKLFESGQILGEQNFVHKGKSVYSGSSHGSMVLSCMASYSDRYEYGTSPKASFWLIKTEDPASEYIIEEYNWVMGAEFADSVGVDIINSSLGYSRFDKASQDHTYADLDGNTTVVTRGADIAAGRGILVVNSAGNEGGNDWEYLIAPSDGDSVLCVGAVDENGNYIFFSSKGPSSDGRIKPDLAARGYLTTIVNVNTGEFIEGNGTSFAAPLMSGLAATLWQAFPELNNMEVIDLMKKWADQSASPDSLKGWGIPNVYFAYLDLINKDNFLKEDYVVTAYPNPFRKDLTLTIKSNESSPVLINIYDVNGKLMLTKMITSFQDNFCVVNLENEIQSFPKGVYIINAQIDNYSENIRIIKI